MWSSVTSGPTSPPPSWLKPDLVRPLHRSPPLPSSFSASPSEDDLRSVARLDDLDATTAVGLLKAKTDPSEFIARIRASHPLALEDPLPPLILVLARYFMERSALLQVLLTCFKVATTQASAAVLVRDLMREGVIFNLVEQIQAHTELLRALLSRRDAVGLNLRVASLLIERRIMSEVVFVASYYSSLNSREIVRLCQLAAALSDVGSKHLGKTQSTSQSIMLAPTAKGSEWVLREASTAYETLYLALLSLLSTLAINDEGQQRLERDEDVKNMHTWMNEFGTVLGGSSQNQNDAGQVIWTHEGTQAVVIMAWGLFLAPLAGKRYQPAPFVLFLLFQINLQN